MVWGHPNLGKVLYMSITYSIHYSASAALNTIFPEMSEQQGYEKIGQIAIMVSYSMEIIGTIYGQNFFQFKRSGLTFFFYGLIPVLTFIPAIFVFSFSIIKIDQCDDRDGICSYYSIVTFSILGYGFQGLGIGTYTFAQNCYLSACSNNNSRELLNGISFTIIGMTYLIGYAYSAPLVVYLGREFFFIVLAIALFTVNLLFLFLPNPTKQTAMQASAANQVNDSLLNDRLSVEISPATDAQSPLNDSSQKGSFKPIILQMGQPSVQTLIPYFLLSGVVLGFVFGQFYQVITECIPAGLDEVIVNQKTFVVFLFFGVGEIISGPIIVLLRGRIDLCNYLRFFTYLSGITLIMTIGNLYLKSYEFCFAIALFWGISENLGQSTSHRIISSQWGDNYPLFALYLVIQNIGAVLYQIFAIFFQYSLIVYALLFLTLIQVVTLISTEVYIQKFYKREKLT